MSGRQGEESEAERELVTSRLVKAPRRLVWQAFQGAEHLGRWWGPDGFRCTTSRFELRPGGEWSFVLHGPGGTDYPNHITWREIVPPERIVYVHHGPDFESTVTLEEKGEGTLVTLRALFPSKAQREAVVKQFRADEGAQQTLARLAALCEAQVRDQ
jgi:uncharacterized protein YndB with AHSA1/START domain